MKLQMTSYSAALALALALAVNANAASIQNAGVVDDRRLLAADQDTANWLSHGRTLDEQRFSPLTQINAGNVASLGLQWYANLDTARGQEATPIVVDGTLYVSTAWSMVKAYDARTGRQLWAYDPKVPRATLSFVCCDAVNRGVAAYRGKIYLGTIDGRLIALDATTGKVVWSTLTVGKDSHQTITGAPRIVKGRVLIGNAGAEYSARGYISAYDAQSGKMVWRFYTVPGDPAHGFEQPELAQAAMTWTGRWWQQGGGGTVWDAITFDTETNLVYFGTGNGLPWNASLRSPEGGDNLYTSSVVAVNADTGQYAWHFQQTPNDRWDFDSDQQIIAATLPVNGVARRVILHAPKNGFFYVLDALTGKFISGQAFATVNWASGLDPVNGRPQIVPAALYDKTGVPFVSIPGAIGAHSWQPMSFSPKTGLVYIPVNEAVFPYATAGKDWTAKPVGFNTGLDSALTAMPADTKFRAGVLAGSTGALVAWDPLAQRARWTVSHRGPSNGGTLATAGDLVFQGTAAGRFNAYSADTGKALWSVPVQTGVIAAPISYSVRGEQYVAVLAGWGGVWDVATGVLAGKSGTTRNISRLLVYRLGGNTTLPPIPPLQATPLDPPAFAGTAEQAANGAAGYARYCMVCHGDAAIAGGLNPDLRHSAMLSSAASWKLIVSDGALQANGMIGWSAVMSPTEVDNIRHYVVKRAHEDKALEATAPTVAARK
jgi:alcohol dehydrogenase (cytochrome c)/quinohemoprotein ethanol dehydrogenase